MRRRSKLLCLFGMFALLLFLCYFLPKVGDNQKIGSQEGFSFAMTEDLQTTESDVIDIRYSTTPYLLLRTSNNGRRTSSVSIVLFCMFAWISLYGAGICLRQILSIWDADPFAQRILRFIQHSDGKKRTVHFSY